MAVLIRTGDMPAATRRDAWREIVCETLGPLDVRIAAGAPLRGQIEVGRLGEVGVGRVLTSTPHSVHRTPGLIRRGSPPMYRLVLALSGRVAVVQDGRTARLGRGEFSIYDFSRPYDLAYESAVELAVFSVPRELLVFSDRQMSRISAVPITSDEGTAALAAPLLSRVATDLDSYQPASAERLSTVVTDLIATSIAERIEQTETLSAQSRDRTLLLQVQAFIEDHLGETDLDPSAVAAAHHVSVRRLHRLFEAQQSTVAGWIRHRRLERCRADLSDPELHDVPVSALASRHGLLDAAHFSRLFRGAYGVPPAEYRRARLLGAA